MQDIHSATDSFHPPHTASTTPVDSPGPARDNHFVRDGGSHHWPGHRRLGGVRPTVAAKGSDGSWAVIYEHAHFTVNANGEVSIEFDHLRATC
jgi:hypothetical protein